MWDADVQAEKTDEDVAVRVEAFLEQIFNDDNATNHVVVISSHSLFIRALMIYLGLGPWKPAHAEIFPVYVTRNANAVSHTQQ